MKAIFKTYFCDSVVIKYSVLWENVVIEDLPYEYWRNNFCDQKILPLLSFQNVPCTASQISLKRNTYLRRLIETWRFIFQQKVSAWYKVPNCVEEKFFVIDRHRKHSVRRLYE